MLASVAVAAATAAGAPVRIWRNAPRSENFTSINDPVKRGGSWFPREPEAASGDLRSGSAWLSSGCALERSTGAGPLRWLSRVSRGGAAPGPRPPGGEGQKKPRAGEGAGLRRTSRRTRTSRSWAGCSLLTTRYSLLRTIHHFLAAALASLTAAWAAARRATGTRYGEQDT